METSNGEPHALLFAQHFVPLPDLRQRLPQHPLLSIVFIVLAAQLCGGVAADLCPWLNPIDKLWRWLRQDILKLHRWVEDWPQVRQRVHDFLDQFAHGSAALLRYVGLKGKGKLATAINTS